MALKLRNNETNSLREVKMPYPYKTFREWFTEEEEKGHVVRITRPIKCGDYDNIIDIGNGIPGKQPETEVRALVRYLHSLPGKPMGIIENPIDNRPDIPVVVNPWPTRERVFSGMGVKTKDELCKKISDARSGYIDPVTVSKSDASCKQVIIPADKIDLTKDIPRVWVEFNQLGWPGCNGIIIMRDPETGAHDLGKLRAGVFDWKDGNPDKPYPEERVRRHMIATMSPPRTGHSQSNSGRHYWSNRRQGKTTPAAYTFGNPTDVHMAASIRGLKWPDSGDEYGIVGAFRGEPMEVVESETTPGLMVPAHAEWVIEGEFLPEDEITPQCGEDLYLGYMMGGVSWPVFRVKCITHRKDPWWTPATFSSSGLNGHEGPHSGLKTLEREVDYINYLRASGFQVKDIVTNAYDGCVNIIQMEIDGAEKPSAHYGKLAAMTLLSNLATDTPPKYVIVVGPDIDPYDYTDVMWALSTRTMPISDSVALERGRGAADVGVLLNRLVSNYGEQLIIDAMIKIPERWESFPPRSDPADWERAAIKRMEAKIRGVA